MARSIANPLGVAYGWNAATQLATQNEEGARSPFNNSDSVALFASGRSCVVAKCRTFLADSVTYRREIAVSGFASVYPAGR